MDGLYRATDAAYQKTSGRHADEHLEAMKKIRPAATALYAALTPEQKKKADELMPLMPGAVGMKMGLRREGR
jgi:TRAP-type uncharacterized transport system substrate-binding protein